MPPILFPRGPLQKAKAAAAKIVNEIIEAMKTALNGKGKKFSPGALDEWRPKLTSAVYAHLLNGGDWSMNKANVLAVAKDMARIAAILSGTSPNVSKPRVHASFRAVKEHAKCPGSAGSGRWCDFGI